MTEITQRHPKGLYVLFTTEMWERFNFYGMRTLLTLFMAEALMMGQKDSSLVYGGFLGLCYLTPMLGGYIADKYLGNRNCILLGGFVMGVGQLLLFTSASIFSSNIDMAKIVLWSALAILIFGNGFFKPNISSMVGQLYPKDQKSRLDSAFTIFYLGINVGATLGQTICPLLGDHKFDGVRDNHAFKWGFLAASMAMFTACIVFYFLKDKYVVTPEGKAIGAKPDKNTVHEGEASEAKFSSKSVFISGVVFVGLVFVFLYAFQQNLIYSIIYSSGITLAGLILTDQSLTKIERDRILVLYIVSFFVIFFWAAFEQAGSSLTFIADKRTDTHILGWEMPPSMVQNFNGIFIIIFAFPFSILWMALSKRKMEPISPVKQAIGLALIALGYFIIATQVKDLGLDRKLGVIWLVVLYLLHTWGELCLSPIGLSLVSKLAPVRFASLLMGVFFLSNASGYALAGTLGSLLPPSPDKYEVAQNAGINLQGVLDKTIVPSAEQLKFLTDSKIAIDYPTFAGFQIHNLYDFFMLFVALPGLAAILLFLINPLLKKMMHGVR